MERIELKQALLLYGMAYDEALRRFSGNEDMPLTFAEEFPDEPYITEILNAELQKDQKAFKTAVHVLKGACGTLSFARLYESCCCLMDMLCAGQNEAMTEPLFCLYSKNMTRLAAQFEGNRRLDADGCRS